MNPFDKRAPKWDTEAKVARSEFLAGAIGKVLEGKNPDGRQLEAMEYGCGTGLVGLAMRDRFSRLVLADSSQGMIEAVQEKIKRMPDPRVEARLLDLSEGEPNVGEDIFDVIFSVQTLHHIRDVDTTLRNLRCLLRPGGTLVLIDMDADGGEFHRDFENFHGHHGFDRQWLTERVTEAGFEVGSVATINGLERSSKRAHGSLSSSQHRGPHRSTLFLLDAVAADP